MPDSSDSEDPRDPITQRRLNARRVLFEPVIGRVVDALGGYEAGVYRMGDEASGCLKDLKKLWRKDDTDDERTIARIFWEKRVLASDLVPILLLTTGAGQVEDRRAISAADLISAMTWPIDMAEELAELEPGERADFTQLHEAHRHYKATILQPAVMSALFAILLPPLAKAPRERTLRDNQVAALVLYIVRNLAAIRDREGLQSKLLRALQETHTIELMLTIATNAESDPLLASWNTLVLEIMFLLFRGTPPATLIEQPKVKLQNLLAAEARAAPTPVSRHSRFGTTIVVTAKPPKKPTEDETNDGEKRSSNPAKALIHKTGDTSSLLDAGKRATRTRAAPAMEAALADDLNPEAREVMRNFARTMLNEGVFDTFVTAVFKDIRMERAWATGSRPRMWLMAVVRWMLTFFLLEGKDDKEKATNRQYGLVAAAAESSFVSFVLKYMREATEEKPKGWPMLYAGMGCLTQILLLLDSITNSSTNEDDPDVEAAQTLRGQLIYAGLPLDLALDCLRACSATNADGRGPAFLDAAVTFAYSMVRMVERAGNEGDKTYVRRARKSGKKPGDADDAHDAEEEERRRKKQQADGDKETTFSLEAFEMKFASAEITKPLLLQLARFKELHSNPEAIRRVVGLLHRVAVRGKAEGLFFNVSTLHLFQAILAAQKSFPRDQPHKDLVALVNFILRRFFKALEEEPFLAVEAFFPKNRGHWKAFSSWEPPEKEKKTRTRAARPGAGELQVKRGYMWSEQLGIVIAALIESGKASLITWTVNLIGTMLRLWTRAVESLEEKKEGDEDGLEDDDDDDKLLEKRMAEKLEAPTAEMLERMQDFLIPYKDDDEAKAATGNPQLKLLWRLAKFTQMDEVDGELEAQWFVGKDVPPADLQRTLKVVEQFLNTPINLQGKKASELLTKTSQRRRAPVTSSSSSDSGDAETSSSAADSDGEGEGKKRKKKKKKRGDGDDGGGDASDGERRKRKQKQKPKKPPPEFKSAQFIEDSDEEYGAMDEFLAREKEMRERIEKMATETGKSAGMRETGTKKRKKKEGTEGAKGAKGRKKRKRGDSEDGGAPAKDSDAESDADDGDAPKASPPRPRPRPKPKARVKPKDAANDDDALDSQFELVAAPSTANSDMEVVVPPAAGSDDDNDGAVGAGAGRRRKNRLVISDDEDE
ncbi:timeless protein-domain-containing protein [Mycena amicta]|nr:timeless protein-domain-containing protein [Mycena amicta]